MGLGAQRELGPEHVRRVPHGLPGKQSIRESIRAPAFGALGNQRLINQGASVRFMREPAFDSLGNQRSIN